MLFHGKRHPVKMGAIEVESFLTHLAVEGQVSASTQNQVLSALLFLYREVLGQDLPWMQEVVRAKRPARLPVVLTQAEVGVGLARPRRQRRYCSARRRSARALAMTATTARLSSSVVPASKEGDLSSSANSKGR